MYPYEQLKLVPSEVSLFNCLLSRVFFLGLGSQVRTREKSTKVKGAGKYEGSGTHDFSNKCLSLPWGDPKGVYLWGGW
jgi:hypothetical protein